MPRSLHVSGRYYEFVNEVVPVKLSREQIHKLVEAFDITDRSNRSGSSDVNKNNSNNNGNGHSSRELWNLQDSNNEQIISLTTKNQFRIQQTNK